MNMVVIIDYYHMTTIDENMYWVKPTHVLLNFSKTQDLLLYIYLYLK